jgi:hypothetical protein
MAVKGTLASRQASPGFRVEPLMSASDHTGQQFSGTAGTYFHGSSHVFDPGEALTPREGYGHVWASGKPMLAARHAWSRQIPGAPGRVYEVRAMADDVEPDPIMPETSSVRSPTGFRVTRDLGNAEDLLFPPRARA